MPYKSSALTTSGTVLPSSWRLLPPVRLVFSSGRGLWLPAWLFCWAWGRWTRSGGAARRRGPSARPWWSRALRGGSSTRSRRCICWWSIAIFSLRTGFAKTTRLLAYCPARKHSNQARSEGVSTTRSPVGPDTGRGAGGSRGERRWRCSRRGGGRLLRGGCWRCWWFRRGGRCSFYGGRSEIRGGLFFRVGRFLLLFLRTIWTVCRALTQTW